MIKACDEQGSLSTQHVHLRSAVIWGLFWFGVLHWCWFLGWGHHPHEIQAYDWKFIHQWLAVAKLALSRHQIPYHVAYFQEEMTSGNFIWSNRYFALPSLIMSPQILLLAVVPIKVWIMLQVVLIYAIGFWGLVKWIRKLNLSASGAAFVLLLFSFNGFHSSRIGVGHIQNVGYFLTPWWLYILNHFAETQGAGLRRQLIPCLQTGLFLLFVLLQGSVQLIQNLFVVGCCALLLYPRRLPWYLLGVMLGIVLSTYLVWPVLSFTPYIGTLNHRVVFTGFLGNSGSEHTPLDLIIHLGYCLGSVYHALTQLTHAGTMNDPWEITAYIGAFGVLLLCLASLGLVRHRGQQTPHTALRSWRFAAGMAVVFILSLGITYHRLWMILQSVHTFPAIDRRPTRMTIYVLTYWILVAAPGFDQIFQSIRVRSVREVVKWSALLFLLLVLMQNSWVWSVPNSASHWTPAQSPALTLAERILNEPGDRGYFHTVHMAYLVSVVTTGLTLVLYLYLRRTRHHNTTRDVGIA